ncbi:MAG: MFS transporter [Planctomycetota bacterium]
MQDSLSSFPVNATRNVRLFLAFRGTTRALLFAPYILHFMTAVRGMSLAEYGVLQAIYYWVVMVSEVPSGVIADRLGRRTTLLVGALVNATGCWLFAASHDFATFAAGEVFFALGTALISGADSAMLYDTLAAEGRQAEYPKAEGAAQAIWLVVTAIGLPLADLFLVRDGDPVLAYWITGGMSVVGAACALAMYEPPTGKRLSTREITLSALRDVAHRPQVRRIILYSIGVFILLRSAIVLFFNPVLEASEVPVDRYGMALAATNVAGALAAFTAHRWVPRVGERATAIAMPVSLVLMYAGLLALQTPAVIALFCIQGAAFGVYPLLVRTILNRHVSSAANRATTISLESMACRIAFSLVAVGAGWGMGHWGLNWTMAAAAAAACLPFAGLLGRRGGRTKAEG